MLHCVRFIDESDLCNYIRQRNIRKDDIINIVYNQSQELYVLFYWS